MLTLLEYAVAPGPLDGFPTLSNPAGLEGAAWLAELDSGPFVGALFMAAAVALVVRFRRSHGVERQQVKWFAFAAGMLVTFLIVVGAALRIVGDDSGDDSIVGGFAVRGRHQSGCRSRPASRSCATGSTTSTS